MSYTISVFLKRFFEPQLAQTSYLIGCVATGEAIVIDPNRDVEPYIAAAAAEKARITHITETHIHADFVSGSRELAARTGATLYVSDEGDANWKYAFAGEPKVVPIKDGDRIDVGNIRLDVLHTPGHTPEHVTFLVTDRAGADAPIAAATGDFIFVGDVGRPDLLERAAGIAGTMDASARALYRSVQRFRERPEWLQIWPGHGAGSSCGKGISAIPHSTLGYELRFNWAFQVRTEEEFVQRVLTGQPDPPTYFARMKQINKAGPPVLGGFPRPARVDPAKLSALLGQGALVVDLRRAADFAVGHATGTINIPFNASFTTWAGWLVPGATDVYLLADDRTAQTAADAARSLAMIGIDRVAGYFEADALDGWTAAGRPLGTIPQIDAADLAESMKHRAVTLIDVRNNAEWAHGHIDGAIHLALGHLPERIAEIPRDRPVVMQCEAGSRSAIAASLLRARGIDRVVNLTGGISAWIKAGHPTTADTTA